MKAEHRGILATTRQVPAANGKEQSAQVICPEASPDAIAASAFGAAFGEALRATTPEASMEKQLNAALSVAQSVASIGLRTQSIQLLRDGMVYNCVLFLNSAISGREAYLLQRRSQNFTLGLLAIEQLTGPVKAQQAALTPGAGGGTGEADTSKQAANLQATQNKLAEARAAHTTAKDELENLRQERGQLRDADVRAQEAKKRAEEAAKDKAADSAEKKAETEALGKAQETRRALEEKDREVRRKEIDVDKFALQERSAEQQVRIAEEDLQLARSRVRAYTNATAVLAASGGANVEITDKIVDAVVQIVDKVLRESGPGEACNEAIGRLLSAETPHELALWTFRYGEVCSRQEQALAKTDPRIKKALKDGTAAIQGLQGRESQ